MRVAMVLVVLILSAVLIVPLILLLWEVATYGKRSTLYEMFHDEDHHPNSRRGTRVS